MKTKLFKQVIFMVVLSLGLFGVAWAGETFAGARDLATPIGRAVGDLWVLFGVFVVIQVVQRTRCGCGNKLARDAIFCTTCGAKR